MTWYCQILFGRGRADGGGQSSTQSAATESMANEFENLLDAMNGGFCHN
jgi:hypothetical protein